MYGVYVYINTKFCLLWWSVKNDSLRYFIDAFWVKKCISEDCGSIDISLAKKTPKTNNWNFLKAYYALCKCPSLFESLKYCEWLFKIISKPSRLLSLGAGISPQFVENTSLIRSLGVMLHQMVWFLPGKLWPNMQERRNEIIKACWWIDFCLQFPDKRTTSEISIKPLVFFFLPCKGRKVDLNPNHFCLSDISPPPHLVSKIKCRWNVGFFK